MPSPLVGVLIPSGRRAASRGGVPALGPFPGACDTNCLHDAPPATCQGSGPAPSPHGESWRERRGPPQQQQLRVRAEATSPLPVHSTPPPTGELLTASGEATQVVDALSWSQTGSRVIRTESAPSGACPRDTATEANVPLPLTWPALGCPSRSPRRRDVSWGRAAPPGASRCLHVLFMLPGAPAPLRGRLPHPHGSVLEPR